MKAIRENKETERGCLQSTTEHLFLHIFSTNAVSVPARISADLYLIYSLKIVNVFIPNLQTRN